jgi:polar amino acid transport system permease protein
MELLQTFFNWGVFVDALPMMLRGLEVTVMLGIVSIVLGLIGGLLLAMLRLYAYAPIRLLSRAFIDVLRSIPLLVLLVLIYYALPFVGIRLSSFAAAVAALSLVSSAYSAEIFRSGIEAIPRGQFEAAASQGMSFFNAMRDVILPQAMRIVMPPMTSNCINVMKDTALASVVAMPDLLKQATQAQALSANPTPLVGAAVMYLLLLLPFVHLVGWIERRNGSGSKKT